MNKNYKKLSLADRDPVYTSENKELFIKKRRPVPESL